MPLASSGSGPRWRFILWAVCQVRMITSPTRPIAWLSDDIIEKRAEVVQDVLGGDRLAADAALGERDVLRDARVEMVAHHQHVEMLVDAC